MGSKLSGPCGIAGTGAGVMSAPFRSFATGRQCLGGSWWTRAVHSSRSPSTHTQVQSLPQTIDGQISVYAVSDLHCDYSANVAWVQGLPSYKQGQQHQHDPGYVTALGQQQQLHQTVCIVAGDISDDLRIVRCAGSDAAALATHPINRRRCWFAAPSSSVLHPC
jgi:hypothetical protein